MEPTDLTIEILRDIRDEVRSTNERVDRLATEVRGVGDHVERMERRLSETEIRVATELVGVAGAVREVRDLLRQDLGLRDRVDDHERRLTAIEKHAT